MMKKRFCLRKFFAGKRITLVIGSLLLLHFKICAQTAEQPPAADSSVDGKSFLDLSLSAYLQSHQPLILSPSIAYRYSHLYTSARYNYEALHTATISGGYRIDGGDATWYSVTPLFGFSFGDYFGVSPEVMGTFGTGNFAFALDAEYSVSFTDSVENLFMLWAGAYYVITPWMFGGITFQRSRLFEPLNNVDAGIALGFVPGAFDVILQANRFWDQDRYFQISVSYFFNPQKSDRGYGKSPVNAPQNQKEK